MPEPTPLRTRAVGVSDRALDSPEALLISALLLEGEFRPEKYHVDNDMPEAWKPLWDFCVNYQEIEAKAPPLELIRMRFPEFELTQNVGAAYAATELIKEAYSRRMRMKALTMTAAINQGDLEGAYAAISGLEAPRTYHRPPADVFDHQVLTERFDVARIPVPYPSLMKATGGIEMGEFWVMAMRLGQGKSYLGSRFCALAAEVGWRVAITSFEMPARQMSRRALRHLAGGEAYLLSLIDSDEEKDRKKAIDIIADRTPGLIHVYDHTMGKINTLPMVRDLAADYDLLMVDHLGLMTGPDGRRAVDDWHVAAHVSNTIREISLSQNAGILGIVQVNRAGEHPGNEALPRPSELAQTDAYGQDASVIITGKRLSARVLKLGAPKVREGQNIIWWSRFDPANNRFEEITRDQANDLSDTDSNRSGFSWGDQV